MSMLFIVVAIFFTVAMIVMMLSPFSVSRDEQLSFELLDEELRQVEALVARKVSLVQSLRDIEYDFKTNKISKEDYDRFTKSCERQAVGVMRRLDAIHGGQRDWEDIIDQAIDERIQEFEWEDPEWDESAPASSAPVEASISSDQTDSEATIGECLCGAALEADDRFCSKCGTPVDERDASPLNDTGNDINSMAPSSEAAR